jgi:uncharacterized protein
MHESPPTLAEEIDTLRNAYVALNRGDVPGFVRMFDPQIERVELFSGRNYHGLAAVTEHVVEGRSAWAEGACEPQQLLAAGNRVVVLVEVRVRLKAETDWRTGSLADVYTFRNGRVTEFRTFADHREAIAWAGLP